MARHYANEWVFWGVIATTGIASPILEEIGYRGLLLSQFRRVAPLPVAIAVQAMLFAYMHLDQYLLLSHFAFGVAAGILRVTAGALWPCVLFHCAWNCMSVWEARA